MARPEIDSSKEVSFEKKKYEKSRRHRPQHQQFFASLGEATFYNSGFA
jgi:hypothetical protein